MKLNLRLLLTVTAGYMGLLGIITLFWPVTMSLGTVPADSPETMLHYLRASASLYLGIALLNGIARTSPRSPARDAIVAGNILGFGLAAILELLSFVSGGPGMLVVLALLHTTFVVGFVTLGYRD